MFVRLAHAAVTTSSSGHSGCDRHADAIIVKGTPCMGVVDISWMMIRGFHELCLLAFAAISLLWAIMVPTAVGTPLWRRQPVVQPFPLLSGHTLQNVWLHPVSKLTCGPPAMPYTIVSRMGSSKWRRYAERVNDTFVVYPNCTGQVHHRGDIQSARGLNKRLR